MILTDFQEETQFAQKILNLHKSNSVYTKNIQFAQKKTQFTQKKLRFYTQKIISLKKKPFENIAKPQ